MSIAMSYQGLLLNNCALIPNFIKNIVFPNPDNFNYRLNGLKNRAMVCHFDLVCRRGDVHGPACPEDHPGEPHPEAEGIPE